MEGIAGVGEGGGGVDPAGVVGERAAVPDGRGKAAGAEGGGDALSDDAKSGDAWAEGKGHEGKDAVREGAVQGRGGWDLGLWRPRGGVRRRG